MTSTDHSFRPNEDRIVTLLRERGASSLEDVSRSVGLDWVPVFSVIDRLSRAGSVVLRRYGPNYYVSLENGK